MLNNDVGRTAVNVVELTYVVARFVTPKKFARTTDVGMNPTPVMVNVTGGAPTTADVGVIELADGLGLFTATETDPDVPPPGGGLTAVTTAVPKGDAILAAVEKTIEVEVLDVMVTPELLPFQSTDVVALKPVPLRVKTPVDPPRIVVGLMPEIAATGLETVNVLPFEF